MALPELAPPPDSPRGWFLTWLDRNGHPFWPYWSRVRGWWEVRDRASVRLVHFNALKRDLPGSIRSIAAFPGIPIREDRFPAILEHCGFDWMKAHASLVTPSLGVGCADGASLHPQGHQRPLAGHPQGPGPRRLRGPRPVAELGPDRARWLATGGLSPAGAR